MERARCVVECWADFGDLLSAKVVCAGSHVILSTGTEHICVFSVPERRVKMVLQVESPVTSLALSADQGRLYALCENQLLYSATLSLESSFSAEAGDDPALSVLSSDSIVMKDVHVLAFVVAENILFTVSLQEPFWNFHFSELPHCSIRSTGYQVSAVTRAFPDELNLHGRSSLAPALACIYPNTSPKRHTSQRTILDHLLFRILFGVDAALLNSPVILCGLPDGRLVSVPLLLPTLTGSTGERKPPIRVLYSLEQPVAFTGTSVIGDNGPQCLVVVGQKGRIMLITANQGSSDGSAADCRFIEHIVQGPVVCACVDGEHLYYSTSTNLFCLSLRKIVSPPSSSPPSVRAESESGGTKPVTTICLNVCRVISLSEPSISPAGNVQLLAMSLGGRLLQVILPQDPDKVAVSRLASSQAGQKIKDLLAGIGNVWERATVEKQQLETKNIRLKRLNHVLNICRMLLNSPKNNQAVCDGLPPIRCQVAVKWSSLLQKDSLVVSCILENRSYCALDHGWTLCLQVQSSLSVGAGGSSRTYSFTLAELDCGQKAEVALPLESDSGVFLPALIHCSLVYTLRTLLNPEEYRQRSTRASSISQLLTHTGCICLALNTLTIDWLDALQITALNPSVKADHLPKQISTWEATRTLLRSRQNHAEQPAMSNAVPHTVAVQISSELLRNRLSLHDCSSAFLCVAALKLLLYGTSDLEGKEAVQSPVVCARGPDRQTVRLLAKEVILSDFSSEGPVSVIEVQVESVSMSAVCGLHHAVLRRVQALLNDAAVKPDEAAELRGQRLCEAVQHMEHLYKDLQDVRDPVGGVKAKRTSDFYLQLREKPLVIL